MYLSLSALNLSMRVTAHSIILRRIINNICKVLHDTCHNANTLEFLPVVVVR